ncbi:hypothetical protein B0H19DRAFT_1265244 [Mycena capillaripes]|nr:hypothetical protein B0H19DRAFT_1265244 [Mycena capillaripes]
MGFAHATLVIADSTARTSAPLGVALPDSLRTVCQHDVDAAQQRSCIWACAFAGALGNAEAREQARLGICAPQRRLASVRVIPPGPPKRFGSRIATNTTRHDTVHIPKFRSRRPHCVCNPVSPCISARLLRTINRVNRAHLNLWSLSKESVIINIVFVHVLHVFNRRVDAEEIMQGCSDNEGLFVVAVFWTRNQKVTPSLDDAENSLNNIS